MRKLAILTGLVMALSTSAASAGPGPKATGGANYTNAGNDVHASFTAQPADDGGDGQVEVRVVDANGDLVQRFHGEVDCYDQSGSNATMTGEVTQLELGTSTNEGMFFRLRVTDGGEGKKATGPDRIIHARQADPYTNCNAAAGTQDVTGGNIQVHA